MSDGSVLYAFQNLYEPAQENNKWIVHYKWNGEWNKETCDTKEKAWDFYHKKTRELRDYYQQFLRELKVRK